MGEKSTFYGKGDGIKGAFLLFSHGFLIYYEALLTCFTNDDTMQSLSKNHEVFKIAVFSHCFPEKKNQQLEFLLSC